jgi:retinol-binding protein 3
VSPRPYLVLLAGLLYVTASADTKTAAIPDTPAGHMLSMWLEAFNTGDRARMEAFASAHAPTLPIEGGMRIFADTGGFDIVEIEKSEETRVIFRAKWKTGSAEDIGTLALKEQDPAVIAALWFQTVPSGANWEDVHLDAASRGRVIDAAIKALDESYVFPDVAKRMDSTLRTRQKEGAYNSIVGGQAFAAKLTDDLRDVSHDKHLRVRFSPVVLPEGEPPGRPRKPDPTTRERLATQNCGFEKAEHLPPNIGYLKFNFFADSDLCGSTAVAAMNFLGDSQVVIFDLRDNHGGDPGMVAFIASYLFSERTHLTDIYDRPKNTTVQSWTSPYVPGKSLAAAKVFVLTSKSTFSGGEEFCYDLKNLKRATLIGEATGGGAHLVGPHRIDDHFSIDVPFGRAINPISKTDWEGTGVVPDVPVPADEALTEALKRARSQ